MIIRERYNLFSLDVEIGVRLGKNSREKPMMIDERVLMRMSFIY